MLHHFEKHIKKAGLFDPSQKVILAVSGGVDSMVMAYLFYKAGFNFDIAHCNFSLRGKEADKDEALVKITAHKYKCTFYSKKFNTKTYAKENKISIQMAARDLRYEWFNELHQNKLCDYIALAHHQNDSAETFLINLVRGTGISGLHGIKAKNGIFIRPLLFADRSQIEAFAQKHQIEFRDDASNLEDKYVRNKIRHQIIPLLESINPSVVASLSHAADNLLETEKLYHEYIAVLKKKIFKKSGHRFLIDINQLMKIEARATVLFEILKPWGFNTTQVDEILESLNALSGKVFLSSTYKLLKDREKLIIEKLEKAENNTVYIYKNTKSVKTDSFKLTLSNLKKNNDFSPYSASALVAFVDADKVSFPLTLRKWEKGDYFMPLGMKKKKKISDFLIDNKMSLFEKAKVKLLCSEKNIIWIAGLRADERYKITTQTKHVLKIEILPLSK